MQKALAPTPVPVPAMVLYEEDPTPARTAFYVMDRVDGRVFRDNRLTALPRDQRRAMYRDLAATLAAIHAVDIARRRPRRLRPPRRLLRPPDRPLDPPVAGVAHPRPPAIDRPVDWLPREMPDDDTTTLVHGDFRTGNVIFPPDAPRIGAVLDWELSTLGHPLADLAHTCASPG